MEGSEILIEVLSGVLWDLVSEKISGLSCLGRPPIASDLSSNAISHERLAFAL